jgi:hypothetical protein
VHHITLVTVAKPLLTLHSVKSLHALSSAALSKSSWQPLNMLSNFPDWEAELERMIS